MVDEMSKVVGVIPARMQSSRLPGKLLLRETGKPLIQYAWEAACQTSSLDQIMIAADSQEIIDECHRFGADAYLTGEHPSGTDRIAEVVLSTSADADLIVNIQGDEPEIQPACIDSLVTAMRQNPTHEMGTLATPVDSLALLHDTGCVKVVKAADGSALYFSRAPIPFYRDGQPGELISAESADALAIQNPWLLHIGIYAYRPAFLLALTKMPPSALEQIERLEQLRALEAGASILVEVVHHRAVGIDTAADYAAFVQRMTS